MALTQNTVPSQVPLYATPFDAQLAFCSAQSLTATGYLNNLNSGQIDLGGANPSSGAGRTNGMWCLNITVMDFTTTDETYKIHLFGSNDVTFANGNVELLAFHDFAALSANRQVATILGATPAIPPSIPPTVLAGTLLQIPFTNLMQRIVYRYLRAYLVAAGTTPIFTVTSWVSFGGTDF